MKFTIELPNAQEVRNSARQKAGQVLSNPKATLENRLLAQAILILCDDVNRLVEQLNYGTATVVVEEDDIRYADKQRERRD